MPTASPIAATSVSVRFRREQIASKARHFSSTTVSFIIGMIILLLIGSLFYIGSHIQIVNVGYAINHELSTKEHLLEENKSLTLEMATLKSPVRLEALAKKQFGMTLPQRSQILNHEETRTALQFSALKPDKNNASPSAPTPARFASKKGEERKTDSSQTRLRSSPAKNSARTLARQGKDKSKTPLQKTASSLNGSVKKEKPIKAESKPKKPATKVSTRDSKSAKKQSNI